MTRSETTEFLSSLVPAIDPQAYWANEVTIHRTRVEYCRVDFMSFRPESQTAGGIERGRFACYEVKSCLEDYRSGHGLNWYGDFNFVVCLPALIEHVAVTGWEGIYIPVPDGRTVEEEVQTPTPITERASWRLHMVMKAPRKPREKSAAELLFYMLRSGMKG